MVVPTKTLSMPKLEITTYSIDFLLIVFSYTVHAIPEKFKNKGDGGGGREQRSPKAMQIPGIGILKK